MSSVPKAASKTIPLEEQEQCYKSDQLKRLDLGRLKATASKIPGLLSQGKELKMENLTEELYVGDASASMKDWFQKQLIKVYMEKMHNEEMAKKCVHIGPLKKFDRIYAKTVNYAVENESKEPILPRVRDILRGTIVFGEDNLRNGDNIIDVVGKVFGAENIIQVKNRFLSGRLPSLPKSWQMRDWSIQHNYIGKDLCYRDLQILVRIPCQHDQMKSIVGEIQIAVEAVFNLKHEGGHKAYKIVRRVLEYEEAKKKNFGPSYCWKIHFAQTVTAEDRNYFGKCITDMFYTYDNAKKYYKDYAPEVKNLINKSKWFAKHAGK